MATTVRPAYLGFLNYFALAEGKGEQAFSGWARKTSDKQLKATLDLVAGREGEHHRSLKARVEALGFALRPREMPDLDKMVEVFSSNRSDKEKIDWYYTEYVKPPAKPSTEPSLADRLKDTTLDKETRKLLERIIPEEPDSGRKLSVACGRVTGKRYGSTAV